jgi:hypothetical protein
MLRDIFDHPSATGAAVIAAKAATIYLFLIIGLRWLGKRELGQMSLYDFVRCAPLHPGGGRDDQRGAERGPRAPHEAPLQAVEAPLSLLPPISAHGLGVQAAKTAIVSALVATGLRLLGKREASQLNVYDLAMLMALANATASGASAPAATSCGGAPRLRSLGS